MKIKVSPINFDARAGNLKRVYLDGVESALIRSDLTDIQLETYLDPENISRRMKTGESVSDSEILILQKCGYDVF